METVAKPKTVDEYFSALPEDIRSILEEVRAAIKQAAPQAKEVISYSMPAFKLNGILVYYAPQKNHVGFYPTSKPIEFFKKELAAYKFSKGAIQFPIDRPMPVDLISKIVAFRVQDDLEKTNRKKQ
jgi:uncharacterized protein YdhG (YjbR/CyaY superfamily)